MAYGEQFGSPITTLRSVLSDSRPKRISTTKSEGQVSTTKPKATISTFSTSGAIHQEPMAYGEQFGSPITTLRSMLSDPRPKQISTTKPEEQVSTTKQKATISTFSTSGANQLTKSEGQVNQLAERIN